MVSRGFGGGENRELLFNGYKVSDLQIVMGWQIRLQLKASVSTGPTTGAPLSPSGTPLSTADNTLRGPKGLSPEVKALQGREL